VQAAAGLWNNTTDYITMPTHCACDTLTLPLTYVLSMKGDSWMYTSYIAACYLLAEPCHL